MKVIIIGGVAGGASAAARLRRLNEKCDITIFERTNYVSYANCGLPYYIGDIITDEKQLTVQTPTSLFNRFNINVKTSHEVIDIDATKKIVIVKDLINDKVFNESYDKLILSPGAKPIIPSFYKKSERVFTLRTIEDTKKVKSYINSNNVNNAVVIGGGYVGIEMAENLTNLGISVDLVEANNQVLSMFDKDIVSFVHSTLRNNGVKLHLNSNVESLNEINDQILVKLENETLITDIVIVAVGVTPDTILAEKIGLKQGVKGSIIVNEHMQTSIEDIYAVGDAVMVKNYVTEEDALVPLAGPANKQGRIAADNICGIASSYQGSLGTSILKVFDLNAASTGLNEKTLINKKMNYEKVILSPLSHAGYYPNAKILTLKVLYEKESLRLLGAQVIGYDGVDKRIDVIATAIKSNLKAVDLKDLELAYAPPFSQAKDPVNLAGFIIDNIENNLVKQFYYEDIEKLRQDPNAILLDTRTALEYSRGHAEGFIHIPLDDLRKRINELDVNKRIYVMCQSGLRSYLATRILVQNGFNAYNFAGGYRLYSSLMSDK